MANQLQDVANRGFANADGYDRHRPSYPASAVDELLEELKLVGKQGARVLDLGAGTGKFTEVLAARDEKYHILAVEPQKDMRRQLEQKNLPHVDVRDGLSYALPVEQDGTFDAVIAAQSFHWYADTKSLDEIHRVLKPGGALGMIWNIDDYNQTKTYPVQTAWERQLRDLTWTFHDATPRYRHDRWWRVFDDAQLNVLPTALVGKRNAEFTLPLGMQREKHRWTAELDAEALWKRYATLSQVAVLEGAERERVRAAFDAILADPAVERTAGGKFRIHGVSPIAWTTKLLDGAPVDLGTDMDS